MSLKRFLYFLPRRGEYPFEYIKLTIFRIRWFICRRLGINKISEMDASRMLWSEPKFIRKIIVHCKGVFMDVGAGFGFYARSAQSAKKVICFEPDQRCIAYLKEGLGDKAEIVPVALSNHTGTQLFHIASSVFHSSLIQPTAPEITTTLVKVDMLDNYVNDIEGGEVVVKIDTEGAEHLILEGGRRFITKHKPTLIIEYHNNLREICRILNSYGYKIAHFRRDIKASIEHGWIVAEPREA